MRYAVAFVAVYVVALLDRLRADLDADLARHGLANPWRAARSRRLK